MLFRLIIVISALLAAFFIPVFILHIKEAVKWRWTLKKELRKLRMEQRLFRRPKKDAFTLIHTKCSFLFTASNTGLSDFSNLAEYIISIAGCFHPDSERPELKASLGHILYCLEKSFERFDQIMMRPGFSSLSSVNIRTVKRLHRLYNTPNGRSSSETRFLYSNLPLLFYSKYLVVDLYIFLGRLAVDIFDKKTVSISTDKQEELEATLKELSKVKNLENNNSPDELLKIKNHLVGMPAILTSDPDFAKWKQALSEAAVIISKKHFPESATPVEEALIGPLLMRTRAWIGTIGKGEGYPVAGQLLKIRLETIFLVKSISDTVMPAAVRKIVMRTQKAYGWVKWPLNVYMWASKGAFVKIALDVGWFTGRKAILVIIFGKTFDKACRELEIVYSQSGGANQQKTIPAPKVLKRTHRLFLQ